MKQQDGMFSAQLKKEDDKLIHVTAIAAEQYKDFVKTLQPGQTVEVFMDVNQDDGTLHQLAKIHKCIRIVAHDTGNTFEDLKLEVKRKAGLCIRKEIDGELFMICKSLGRCSTAELSLAIQALIEIGDTCGINLR